MLLEHIDPFFAELDRVSKQAFGAADGAGIPMDVTRRGDELIVRADLPGVPAEHIDVSIEGRMLTLTAHRASAFGEDEQVLRQERLEGTLTRRLRVPDWVDGRHVSASHVDGQLTIRLPLAEQARPHRVEVQRGADGDPARTPTEISATDKPAA
jgi:HSP20 family protein